MTDEDEVLKRIASGRTLFTEYEEESTWKHAFSLRQKGLVEGTSLLTGTARFRITEVGKSYLASLDERSFADRADSATTFDPELEFEKEFSKEPTDVPAENPVPPHPREVPGT